MRVKTTEASRPQDIEFAEAGLLDQIVSVFRRTSEQGEREELAIAQYQSLRKQIPLLYLILLANGYAIANIPGDTDSRRAYYDALEKANLEADKSDFLRLIARHVLQGSRTLLERLGAA